MKKFISNVLIFFAVIGIMDIGVGFFGDYLMGHAKGGSTKKLDDLVRKDTHDILVLGSSRACLHYDTPLLSDSLGLDVYNAGYAGNGVVLSVGLLEMVLNRYQPKMIIFDIEPSFDIYEYPNDNNNIRYIKNLKPYYNQKGIAEIIKDVSMEEWYKVHSGMIRYNTEIIPRIVDNVINRGMEPQGYSPVKGVMTEEPVFEAVRELTLDPFKIKYIQKLISLCNSKKVPLLLIASPKYGAYDSSILEPAKDLAIKNNVPYLDFYSDSLFNCHKEWFNEPMHLNEVGAREYSNLLVGIISSMLSIR